MLEKIKNILIENWYEHEYTAKYRRGIFNADCDMWHLHITIYIEYNSVIFSLNDKKTDNQIDYCWFSKQFIEENFDIVVKYLLYDKK
jgi:hypothetical protein